MNGPYFISYFCILLFKTHFIASKSQLYIPESITLLNCQCNVFWRCVAIIIAAAIKKDCIYRNNCNIRSHDGVLGHSLTKAKNKSSYVFLPIFMFCPSRFRSWNLKDANSCLFSWCITTSIVLNCSWHDMTLSHFVQLRYCIYSKSLLFTSISYVQESFKLNEVNHG